MVKHSIVLTYMTLYLLFGAGTTIIIKAMDLLNVKNKKFAHPYIQCATLFLGESLCLLIYITYKYIKRRKNRVSEYRELRRRYSKTIPSIYMKLGVLSFGFPGILYVFSVYLMFIGLALSAASVYQIIRGILIVPVLGCSLIFLRRRFFRHHIFGVICILIGVITVGADSVFEKSSSSTDPIVGSIVLVISQFIAGIVLVFEEYLMSKMDCEPVQAIGVEGLTGLIFSIFVLVLLNFISCDNQDFCYGGRVENTIQVIEEIFSNKWLLLLFFSSIVVITVLYWSGIYTTRYASALARATLDSARIVIVWVFSILMGWEDFLWIEFAGFVVLVFGTLVYNEIIVIPFWGFKESVKMHKNDQTLLLAET